MVAGHIYLLILNSFDILKSH